MTHDENPNISAFSLLAGVLPALAGLAVLTFLGMVNFLMFHTLIELFSVVVSFAAFLIAWNMRRRMDNGFLLLIAIAYAFTAVLDLAHLLTYKGMGVFPDLSANVPTQLWLAARFLQAASLLIAPLFVHQPLPARPALFVYTALTLLLLGSIFRPWPFFPAFPDCFIEGDAQPLTRFKILGEYVLCGILGAAFLLFMMVRRSLDKAVMLFMTASLTATILSELVFARYYDLFGSINLAGHLLKGLAVYLAYKALIEAGLIRPFDVLFRSASQSRQQVLESEERFRTLSSATFEGIAITENGRIVDVNEQLLALLGCRREDMIGEPISSFLEPDARERALEDLRDGVEKQLDYRMIRKDGTFVHAETHGKKVNFKNRTVRVIAIRDITDRKRAEATLLEARNTALRAVRELARSNRDLEQFAHVTSHDLKEPLRMVTGFMGLLRDRHEDQLDARGRECIAFAVEAAQRMQRLIDDLLDYSKLGTDERMETFPLADAAGAALQNLNPMIRSSGARIRCDPLPSVHANRREMTLLFQNLLSNALKFRSQDPPEIRIGAGPKETDWDYFVSDNGIGIDPAYQDQLFRIFQRLHPAEDYPGSGIGLAICKKIVERYNGTIRVESEAGKGATFHFTLPDARSV